MSGPRVVKVERTHGIATWQNVIIAAIQGDVDAKGIRSIHDAYQKLSEAYPAGIVGITLLRTSLSVGNSDTNAEAKRALHELRSKITHVSIVIENQGFVAQLLRTVIRALNSIVGGSRLSIAGTLEEATATVAPLVMSPQLRSTAQTQRELLAAIANLERALLVLPAT